MRKLFIVPIVVVLGMAVSAQDALAQRRSHAGPSLRRSNRPTTSPYLNLLDSDARGNGIGFNYFSRVRPEIQLRNQGNKLQGSLDNLQRQAAQQQQEQPKQSGASALTPTGHAATFMNYGNYYASPGGR